MDKNSVLNLEDKINIIYDYIYNINTQICYSFNKLDLGKIGLEDIKIPIMENEIYDKLKTEVIDGKFKMISFDEETNQILIKKYTDQFSVNIKISFYKNENNINLLENEINNDSLFSYLLSQLVLARNTKHILLPIINIDSNLSNINKLLLDDSIKQKIENKILNNEITNTCCLQLREHFFKTTNLEEYLKENTCSYKILLFQIIHTLAIIQKEFNGFRHNNLILKNIIIYLKNKSNTFSEYIGFKNDHNDIFYLPNSDFDIKITNFEHATIPKFYGHFNYNNSNIKFADKHNPYYDLYTFLNDLLENTTILTDKNNCDPVTKKFLDKIIPPHIRGLNENFNKNIIIVSPSDLLYDKYFDEFRNKPPKNNDEVINNNLYLTNRKIDTFMDSDNFSTLGKQNKIISKSSIMNNKYYGTRNINSKKNNNLDINKRYIKEDTVINKLNRINTETEYDLVGGGDKPELAPFKKERTSPFVSNEERETFKKRTAENPVREPPVLLEQKVYDTSQRSAPKPQYPPTYIPLYDQTGSVVNRLLPYDNIINQPPLQKTYNITVSNPLTSQTTINKIYEDILPGDPFTFSALTLFQRKQLIDFFRNSVLDSHDGEEMNRNKQNTLLSYIKIMDINPYTINKNPYLDLPKNFILYRAAYPIRLDERTNSTSISKSSMGLNIRMYMLSLGDLRCKTINNLINADNFDVWREIKYYDWVRDDLLKRKVSPNFIAPILYKIDSTNIDWNNLNILRNKGFNKEKETKIKHNEEKINKLHNILKKYGLFTHLLSSKIKSDIPPKPDEAKEDLTINSGKTLILLTEAPTTSFVQWSTSTYESFGPIKKMISTGYHTPDVWKSVLFQLVYAFAVLQKSQVYISNLSLENNIYIKDIYSDPNAVGSWIYKVDNIEFYIPNYGYILLIDSKYSDIENEYTMIKTDIDDKQKYKIYGSLYKKNSHLDETDLRYLIYTQFKHVLNPDNFGHNFKIKGGSIPDESIINLIKNIFNDNNINISEYLINYFGEFMHNRIGTLLYKSERDVVNPYLRPDFNRGNLMIYQKRYNEYEWVVYIGDIPDDPLRKRIYRKEGNNFIFDSVFTGSLYGFPNDEKILPTTKQNLKYDEAHIYETYDLDNLIL